MDKKLERKYTLDMPIVTSASDTLKETLEMYGVTQKDFAEHLQISQTYLSDILNRRKFMSEDIALRIQQVTKISAKFLLQLDFQYKLEQMKNEEEAYKELEPYDWAM